jgi:hypothetical protein
MSQNVAKAMKREIDNQHQGRSGSETMKKPGPVAGGNTNGNPTSGGGIFRPTKGKK